MSKSSAGVCLRSLSESKGPPKSCPSLQAGVCLCSLSENKGPSKSCQSCPGLQGSDSAVSQRTKDHQSHVQVFRPASVSTVSWRTKDVQNHVSHVQVFRGLSPQSLGEQRTFKVMIVMSKSSDRSLSLQSLG